MLQLIKLHLLRLLHCWTHYEFEWDLTLVCSLQGFNHGYHWNMINYATYVWWISWMKIFPRWLWLSWYPKVSACSAYINHKPLAASWWGQTAASHPHPLHPLVHPIASLEVILGSHRFAGTLPTQIFRAQIGAAIVSSSPRLKVFSVTQWFMSSGWSVHTPMILGEITLSLSKDWESAWTILFEWQTWTTALKLFKAVEID